MPHFGRHQHPKGIDHLILPYEHFRRLGIPSPVTALLGRDVVGVGRDVHVPSGTGMRSGFARAPSPRRGRRRRQAWKLILGTLKDVRNNFLHSLS